MRGLGISLEVSFSLMAVSREVPSVQPSAIKPSKVYILGSFLTRSSQRQQALSLSTFVFVL